MSIALSLLLLAQSTSAVPSTTDKFGALRAIVLPVLLCERGFDVERRKLAGEERAINSIPNQAAADGDKQWREAMEAFRKKEGQFRSRRFATCQTQLHLDRFNKRLGQIRSDISPSEIYTFSNGLFRFMQNNEELFSDFAASYDHKQFTPPTAPTPVKKP